MDDNPSVDGLRHRLDEAIDALSRGNLDDSQFEALVSSLRMLDLSAAEEAIVLEDPTVLADVPLLHREVRRREAHLEQEAAANLCLAVGAGLDALRTEQAGSMAGVDDYDDLLADEVDVIRPLLTDDPTRPAIAFVGCGPMPMSVIRLRRLLGRLTVAIEKSATSAYLAREVLRRCDLTSEIDVVHADAKDVDFRRTSFVHMASLTEGKADVARRAVVHGVPLVAIRSGHRLCRLAYEALHPSSFEAFGLELVAATSPSVGVRYQTFVFRRALG